MSRFVPIDDSIDTSLLGAGIGIFENKDYSKLRDGKLRDKRYEDIHQESNFSNFVMLIISAIVFVTVVALFDIIRGIISNYFSRISLTDPKSNNSQNDINRTQIANVHTLRSTICFGLICLIISLISIPLLFFLKERILIFF